MQEVFSGNIKVVMQIEMYYFCKVIYIYFYRVSVEMFCWLSLMFKNIYENDVIFFKKFCKVFGFLIGDIFGKVNN